MTASDQGSSPVCMSDRRVKGRHISKFDVEEPLHWQQLIEILVTDN